MNPITYDEANRLIRENNSILNQTIVYDYTDELWGNLQSKKIYAYTTIDTDLLPTLTPIDTIGYTYNSTDWTDQLVSYNGQTINYDSMGNPTTYRGYTMTWRGKQLTSASNGTNTLTFEYNEDGLRQKKTVNGVDTNYFYNGSVLIGMQRGTSKFLFSYDASGNVVSVNYNGTEYYYLRNAQGDIVKIIDAAGNPVVEYTYDTWGKKVSTTGSLAGTLGLFQPFRYRGYVYDWETGFYYLQSRYYDPTVGRFISADVFLSTGQGVLGHNCYAYCGNNPVSRIDSNGAFWEELWEWLFGGGSCAGRGSKQESSPYGAAKPYESVPGSDDPSSPNCYSFAIGSPVNQQPGQASQTTDIQWNDIKSVGAAVEADLKAMGYTVRRLENCNSPIQSNEFRIALRVGEKPYKIVIIDGKVYLRYDYHFMRQTNTGQWAEKHGPGGDSILHGIGETPDDIAWTLYGEPYYDSEIYYYAVGE